MIQREFSIMEMQKNIIRVFIVVGYICLGLCQSANAQIMVTGKIVDADSGQPLATANIRAVDTFFATISNEDGVFVLEVSEFPVTLIITHIGYADQKVLVNEAAEVLSIRMQPVTYPFEEIVVTSDMGSAIMQKVIEQKGQWRPKLKHFKAMAYTRQVAENLEDEARIVGIGDLVSEIHWDRDRGFRELIVSKRHTKNVPEWLQTYSIVKPLKSLPNIYDDEVFFAGNRIIGPAHPDALNFYHFELREQQYNGEQTIYEISLRPKTKLQPAFMGRVFVLDEAFVILRAELELSSIIYSSAPLARVKTSLLQQFQAFGDNMWLPIDFHLQIGGSGGIPGLFRTARGRLTLITQLKNFEINQQLSTQIYERDQIVSVDDVSVREDSLFTKFSDRMPFSEREEKAYGEIDEKLTIRKAFPPYGPLARWVTMSLGPLRSPDPSQVPRGIDGFLVGGMGGDYNRVSMADMRARIGFGVVNSATGRRDRLFLEGGYAQGPARWIYRAEFWHEWGRVRSRNQGRLSVRHRAGIVERYYSYHYGFRPVGRILSTNNILSRLGWDDYYDYYWRESTYVVFFQTFLKRRMGLTVGFHDEKHSSLSKQTDFNILGRDNIQRPNPPVDEGRIRYIDFRFRFVKSRYKRVAARVEWGSSDLFKSDFSYVKYELGFDWRIETFLKRRAVPNVLDVRVTAGTFTGDLPVQRFGVLDVWRPFTSFGTFKHLNGYPYEGEKYLGVYWQHNFRSAPFEMFNMEYLGKRGFEIALYGGSGRTWISKEKLDALQYQPHVLDKFYHEAGVSLNMYHGIRINATKRLDEDGFSIRANFTLMRPQL